VTVSQTTVVPAKAGTQRRSSNSTATSSVGLARLLPPVRGKVGMGVECSRRGGVRCFPDCDVPRIAPTTLRGHKPGAARQPCVEAVLRPFFVSPKKVTKERRPRRRCPLRGFPKNGSAKREAHKLALRAQTYALLIRFADQFFGGRRGQRHRGKKQRRKTKVNSEQRTAKPNPPPAPAPAPSAPHPQSPKTPAKSAA
jgi:hypothetical protein